MHCWVFLLASSASLDRRPGCADFHPQIFTNLRFCAQLCTQLYLVPVSVVPPLPTVSPLSTLWRRPHKARRLVRFKVLRRIDRPEQSAANCLQISKTGCVQSSQTNPATYTLERRLVVLRNQNVAGVPTGCSLARRPPAAAGMAARPGDNLRLPPTFRFHL